MTTQDKITCPTCGQQNTWRLDNSFRPFCSDRCKLIDLGEWADESRKIPCESVDPEAAVFDEDPNDSGEYTF